VQPVRVQRSGGAWLRAAPRRGARHRLAHGLRASGTPRPSPGKHAM